MSNIHVIFKNNTNFNAVGVRARGPVLGAAKSTLTNIIVDDLTSGMSNIGVVISDTNVISSNINVNKCLNGGVNISADAANAQLINCTATSCGNGFSNSAPNAKLMFCEAISSVSEGFRDYGTSESSYAFCQSIDAGTYGFRSVSGSVNITLAYCKSSGSGTSDYATGASARAFMCDGYIGDSLLQNSDSAYVQFGDYSGLSTESVTGYVSIKDNNGNIRKIATVS